jgi:hypothetical protein
VRSLGNNDAIHLKNFEFTIFKGTSTSSARLNVDSVHDLNFCIK